MAYLAAERAKERNWKLRTARLLRITRILVGFAVSVAFLPGLIVFGGNLTGADGIHIPVIRAAAGPWRRLPEDPGGKVTEQIGYTVNRLLIGKQAAEPSADIILADPPSQLRSEDMSYREFMAARPGMDLRWLSGDGKSEHDLKQAGQSVAELSPVSGRQIDPMHVGTEPVQVHVGAFKSRDAAESARRKFNLFLGALPRGCGWMIQRAVTGGVDEYRLRVAGFADQEEAAVFCGRLTERGADCSPVAAN